MDKMSVGEWKRLSAVERVERGELKVWEAALLLGVSDRQVRRIRLAVEERGAGGVIHGNRGREPANRLTEAVQRRVKELLGGKYEGFNDTHFAEKLREVEGVEVSRASVQRIRQGAGIRAARRRRARKHRRRRERRAREGLMILWDGSRHDWLEERGPMLCLVAAVDDATGALLPGAHLVEQECAAGYLRVLREIAREKGLPWSAYMDQHGSLKRNDKNWSLEEELRGRQFPTQVGQALEALGIEVIYALSPQAKGRVERMWETLQDRLVSELRLVKASTQAAANAVLERFVPDYNRRFAVEPAEAVAAWRPVPKGLDLERACSAVYGATVLNDNTVRLGGMVIDIPPGPRKRSYAKARVEVRQLLDGSWRVYLGEAMIAVVKGTTGSELRMIERRGRRRPPPSAAWALGKTPRALRARSVFPSASIDTAPAT
jgi:Winged helix-turn helix